MGGKGKFPKEDDYFYLDPSVRGIPLYMKGLVLKLAILEVGYKPKGKSHQLKWKKAELLKQNLKIYKPYIDIYKGLVHYTPDEEFEIDLKTNNIKFVIEYNRFSSRMLEQFSKREIKYLLTSIPDNKEQKNKLGAALENCRPNRLESLVKEYGNKAYYGNFKGELAELMAFKDITKALQPGMNFFNNVIIPYTRKNKLRKTEIDGIFTFYEPEKIVQMLDEINKHDSVNIIVGKKLKKIFLTYKKRSVLDFIQFLISKKK